MSFKGKTGRNNARNKFIFIINCTCINLKKMTIHKNLNITFSFQLKIKAKKYAIKHNLSDVYHCYLKERESTLIH